MNTKQYHVIQNRADQLNSLNVKYLLSRSSNLKAEHIAAIQRTEIKSCVFQKAGGLGAQAQKMLMKNK